MNKLTLMTARFYTYQPYSGCSTTTQLVMEENRESSKHLHTYEDFSCKNFTDFQNIQYSTCTTLAYLVLRQTSTMELCLQKNRSIIRVWHGPKCVCLTLTTYSVRSQRPWLDVLGEKNETLITLFDINFTF